MTEYDNNRTGVLFTNNKRTEGSNQPAYNGKCEIDGKKYQLSAWIKEGANCGKFLSISIQDEWKPEGNGEAVVAADAADFF